MPIPLLTLALMGGSLWKARENGQRKQAAEDERLAAERADREFVQGERNRTLQLRKDMAAAAAPAEVEQPWQPSVDDEGNAMPQAPAFKVGAQRFASQTDAAAAAQAANTQPARLARMGDVLERAGEPVQAQSLRTGARQEESADLQTRAHKQAWEDQTARRDMGTKLAKGGWSGAPEVYKQYGDGRTMTLKENGKGGASVAFINSDGTQAHNQVFESLPEFFSWASMRFDPAKWAADQQQRDQQRKTEARDERDFGLRKMLTMSQIAHLSAQSKREQALADKALNPGQVPAAPVWDKTADDFLMKRYTKADPVSGVTAVDGAGLTFAKQIALAQAMRNGGDTTSALGYAFEVDAQLAKEAGNDPAKINAARQALLSSLRAAPVRQGEAPATQAAPQVKPVVAQQQSTKPATERKTYTYGLMSGPRVEYLSRQKAQGTANAAELDELAQLLATKDKAWFRGKASDAAQIE